MRLSLVLAILFTAFCGAHSAAEFHDPGEVIEKEDALGGEDSAGEEDADGVYATPIESEDSPVLETVSSDYITSVNMGDGGGGVEKSGDTTDTKVDETTIKSDDAPVLDASSRHDITSVNTGDGGEKVSGEAMEPKASQRRDKNVTLVHVTHPYVRNEGVGGSPQVVDRVLNGSFAGPGERTSPAFDGGATGSGSNNVQSSPASDIGVGSSGSGDRPSHNSDGAMETDPHKGGEAVAVEVDETSDSLGQYEQIFDNPGYEDVSTAKVQILDKTTGEVRVFDISVGAETIAFKRIRIELAKCFKSPENERLEYIGFLNVWEIKGGGGVEKIYSNWSFSSHSVNILEHPIYDVRIVNPL